MYKYIQTAGSLSSLLLASLLESGQLFVFCHILSLLLSSGKTLGKDPSPMLVTTIVSVALIHCHRQFCCARMEPIAASPQASAETTRAGACSGEPGIDVWL
jgi:hypothetical protein